jgi:hypothetical protein
MSNHENTNHTSAAPLSHQLIAAAHLKKRGWTEALISSFLGAPDAVRANPYYPSARPMRLYLVGRVQSIETSAAFQQAQAARKLSRQGAQRAVQTKKQQVADYLAGVHIEVPCLAREELIRRACKNYNANTRGDSGASAQSDALFLERICVNYLRHRLTRYESCLDDVAGKVGAAGARCNIKNKVLQAIAERYEWLRVECARQQQPPGPAQSC